MSDINEVLKAIGDISSRLDSYDERFDSIEAGMQDGQGQPEEITEQEISEAIEALREQGYGEDEIEAIISSEIDEFYGEEAGEEGEEEGRGESGGTDIDGENRVGTMAGQAAAAQPSGEEGGEFARLERIVTNLEAKIHAKEQAEAAAEVEHQFKSVENKIVELAAQNDDLRAQLSAAKTALKSNGGHAVELGTPNQGGDFTKGEGEFEQIISTHLEEGKSKSEAISLAARDNKGAHTDWLRRNGVIG
jgi:hypothetical protein